MKFCIKCDNMYYLSIDSEDPNKLVYYCRNCGYNDTTLTEEGVCIMDTQFQKKEQKFNHIVNKYTKLDPTLPRIYNMKCPNEACKTNKKDENSESIHEKTEIIYMRYDDVNLKYIYICPTCDTNWLSN